MKEIINLFNLILFVFSLKKYGNFHIKIYVKTMILKNKYNNKINHIYIIKSGLFENKNKNSRNRDSIIN